MSTPTKDQESSKNGTFEWNKKTTLKLIAYYKANPMLWDNKLEGYRHRQNKRKVWLQIARALGMPVFEVQRKMHNLRTQFNGECKKGKAVKAEEGSGSGEVYKSKWEFLGALSFMKPGATQISSSDDILDSDLTFDDSCDLSVEESCEPPVENAESFKKSTAQKRKPETRPVEDDEPTISKTTWMADPEHDETDDLATFSTYVLSEIRQLKSNRAKRKLKRMILNCIIQVSQEEDEADQHMDTVYLIDNEHN